jgi:hydrogenase maturation protease
MSAVQVLIAGIGNIFLGDDAFGSEVAQRLLHRPHPEGVQVVDFGIRGLDLTYALLDGCKTAILIDAVLRGEAPGTLFVIEPTMPAADEAMRTNLPVEGHSMNPLRVLQTVASMGGGPERVLLVGCEPTPISSDEEMSMELSPPVRASLDQAVEMVESLARQALLDYSRETTNQKELLSC